MLALVPPRLSRALAILAALAVAPTLARGAGTNPLTVLERVVTQDRIARDTTGPEHDRAAKDQRRWQFWQIDYRLRNDGATELVVNRAEISAKVEGWVSNSRIASHASPRRSVLNLSASTGLAAVADIIESADEVGRCRERGVLHVWTAEPAVGPDHPAPHADPAQEPATIRVAPGATVRVRLRLEHQHFIYGPYDPLLGPRTFELHLGASATFHDTLPLDHELHVAQAEPVWMTPPADRLDTSQYISAPDSLHLEAHVPGNHQYRFPEQPVRYATKMRLSYWYLIAPGTRGECRARVYQYKDTPTVWKNLSDGNHEEWLTTVGRWVHVERTFRTEADATTLALDFRIVGADIGEVWIDDVTLEPVAAGHDRP